MRVQAEVRVSETAILKRENLLLWVMVVSLFFYSLYMNDKVNRMLVQANQTGVTDATRSAK